MDLNRLKIDRAPRSSRQGRGRSRSPWFGRVVLVLVVGTLLWLFRGPLVGWLDRLRLPEVEVSRVFKRSPAAAGAMAGAASNGYVVASTRAALSADTPGRIVEINVREGQAVKKGFLVARLYDKEYTAALRRADADLQVGQAGVARAIADKAAVQAYVAQLRAEIEASSAGVAEADAKRKLAAVGLERVRSLARSGAETEQALDESRSGVETTVASVVSARAQLAAAEAAREQGVSRVTVAAAAVDEARAQVEALRAARDLAQATLDKTEVRAPFDGVVVLKDAEVGEVVSPNSQAGGSARGSVVTMVDFASLEVQAEVPETTIAKVRVGASVKVFLDAFPEKPYSGRVDRIWPTADRQKATIEVRAVFDQVDDRLRPEMGVRVVFLPDDDGSTPPPTEDAVVEDVILVPEGAVVDGVDTKGVFVVFRDVVQLRAVELGGVRGGRAIVKRGLEGGEQIVIDPPTSLADGDRIRIKTRP